MQALQNEPMLYHHAAMCRQTVSALLLIVACRQQKDIARHRFAADQNHLARRQFAGEVQQNQTILPQFNLQWSLPKSFQHAAFCSCFSQKVLAEMHVAACSPKSFGPAAKCSGTTTKIVAAMLQAAPCRRMVWTCIALHRLLAKWLGSAASGGEYFSFGLML